MRESTAGPTVALALLEGVAHAAPPSSFALAALSLSLAAASFAITAATETATKVAAAAAAIMRKPALGATIALALLKGVARAFTATLASFASLATAGGVVSGLLRRAAVLTAGRLAVESLLLEELLLAYREEETGRAVATLQFDLKK